MLVCVFSAVGSLLVAVSGVQFAPMDFGQGYGLKSLEYTKFEDLKLPSPEQFAQNLEENYRPKVIEFLGYAVPTVATALFIRSSLNR